MMSGYDCLNKKRCNSRRKVDSEFAATTSVVTRTLKFNCDYFTLVTDFTTIACMSLTSLGPTLARPRRAWHAPVARPGTNRRLGRSKARYRWSARHRSSSAGGGVGRSVIVARGCRLTPFDTASSVAPARLVRSEHGCLYARWRWPCGLLRVGRLAVHVDRVNDAQWRARVISPLISAPRK